MGIFNWFGKKKENVKNEESKVSVKLISLQQPKIAYQAMLIQLLTRLIKVRQQVR